ncbi:hypothetical protein L484_012327 [Morus notabilis]|uniref:Uncharacterized protein n=1 Tax=Morus notabilis TaxID=981085 RepID=W9RVA4_9ROSA|nr:hypothetical protein L484_012327 [Morus notabilis]
MLKPNQIGSVSNEISKGKPIEGASGGMLRLALNRLNPKKLIRRVGRSPKPLNNSEELMTKEGGVKSLSSYEGQAISPTILDLPPFASLKPVGWEEKLESCLEGGAQVGDVLKAIEVGGESRAVRGAPEEEEENW